nr:hypothetical protein CFP56_18536 [Quercus suber]
MLKAAFWRSICHHSEKPNKPRSTTTVFARIDVEELKTQKSKVSSHLDSSTADSTSLITEERIISRFGSIVVGFFWYYCCTVTEADAELKEEVKHLKSMLKQQAIQTEEQRRHFEEQQAS